MYGAMIRFILFDSLLRFIRPALSGRNLKPAWCTLEICCTVVLLRFWSWLYRMLFVEIPTMHFCLLGGCRIQINLHDVYSRSFFRTVPLLQRWQNEWDTCTYILCQALIHSLYMYADLALLVYRRTTYINTPAPAFLFFKQDKGDARRWQYDKNIYLRLEFKIILVPVNLDLVKTCSKLHTI